MILLLIQPKIRQRNTIGVSVWAGGQPMGLWLYVMSSWTTVLLPAPNEVIAGQGLQGNDSLQIAGSGSVMAHTHRNTFPHRWEHTHTPRHLHKHTNTHFFNAQLWCMPKTNNQKAPPLLSSFLSFFLKIGDMVQIDVVSVLLVQTQNLTVSMSW